MHSLAEFLYPEPAPRTVPGIVRWWEKRRLFYNVAVGSVGLVVLVAASTVVTILEGRFVIGPWIGALLFGVMANVCYCLGPVIEILLAKIGGRTALRGPALYRMGLTFSLGLALLPLPLVFFAALIRIVLDANFP